jgi:hypothetical protein
MFASEGTNWPSIGLLKMTRECLELPQLFQGAFLIAKANSPAFLQYLGLFMTKILTKSCAAGTHIAMRLVGLFSIQLAHSDAFSISHTGVCSPGQKIRKHQP